MKIGCKVGNRTHIRLYFNNLDTAYYKIIEKRKGNKNYLKAYEEII